ncbi:ATP-binding protein [Pedobacter sp. BS3]|uniref:ATP-binding protein n=1 Tax=Pedobacter sp. BS3 TaxID=2567937 RepID=UPI0011ED3759|nr:AAA family ATPase [Pedobacter sp. BS3]TZF83287.1 ATP-binding protein [Pedobacter sp. BS3]
MFWRKIHVKLREWADKADRKPLVIRGARQVGKTTVINDFGKKFDQYIYLNLELDADKQPFLQFRDIEILVQALFFVKNKTYSPGKTTLLCIDEIQEVPEALNVLRYFYEEAKHIHVIAAGSLLETIFDQKINFPVGRVEFLVLRPASFDEFLDAVKENSALKQLQTVPLPDFAIDKLFQQFHIYALIGGMPEIVAHYANHKDLTALAPIYESLIASYLDDVEKYASGHTFVQVMRHVIRAVFVEAGNRIKFEGFGKSNYRSREIGEALRTLEKALIAQLIYPHTGYSLPIIPDFRKSPRLQVLDTGMLNYFLGVQRQMLGSSDLTQVYQGKLVEHLVGQELLAGQFNALSALHFWVREKNTSMAEVDYIYNYKGKLVPIEVKSGAVGKLKSLHLYMEGANHNMAVRFYAGNISIDRVSTPAGKAFYLLNLPYFLTSQIEPYLSWMEQQISKH